MSRRPVLILRSCRATEFAAALRVAREQHPDAEIVALSHHGHRDALLAAGVDRVIEVPGRRFGPFRLSPFTWHRLRAERFATVVIPQMTAFADEHANLYGLVALLRWRRALVLPAGEPIQEFDRPRFLSFTCRNTLRALLRPFDTIQLLAILAAAPWLRRRAPRTGKRRVLHIISSLGVGGAQVQLAELLQRTPPDQYDVDLLALGADDGFATQWLTRPDVRVTVLRDWQRVMPTVREVAARCRNGRYDIVHTWLFLANVIGAAGARLAGVPYVISSVRNMSTWKRDVAYRHWWYRPADVLTARAADVVTVNATALAGDHAAWALMPATRIAVVHNGLDPTGWRADRAQARRQLLALAGANEDATLVGTVGRLAPEKDHAAFLRALARVRQVRPDVHGVLIGDGALRDHLERVTRELGIGDAVTFLGTRSDARLMIAGLDLFMLTSWTEGFPNVLLEATLLGVPCAATDVGGNPDVLSEADWLFPARDAERAAATVLAMLADRAQTARRQAAMQHRALTLFTADRSAAAWLTIYDRSRPPATAGASLEAAA